MLVCEARGYPASWGAVEEAYLDKEGLVNLFEGILLFGQCCG
jgi:hypothetical protein